MKKLASRKIGDFNGDGCTNKLLIRLELHQYFRALDIYLNIS